MSASLAAFWDRCNALDWRAVLSRDNAETEAFDREYAALCKIARADYGAKEMLEAWKRYEWGGMGCPPPRPGFDTFGATIPQVHPRQLRLEV